MGSRGAGGYWVDKCNARSPTVHGRITGVDLDNGLGASFEEVSLWRWWLIPEQFFPRGWRDGSLQEVGRGVHRDVLQAVSEEHAPR